MVWGRWAVGIPLLPTGFLPVSSNAGLQAVPAQPCCCAGVSGLPEALPSKATSFQPVVLAQDPGEAR